MRRWMLCALLATGCGGGLHSLSGRVESPIPLAGHHLEAELEGSPTTRASGVIGPDGSFRLESLVEGKVRIGAPEGRWRLRLVPADEDEEGRKIAPPAVPARYFWFESSEWSLALPASGEIVLKAEAR